MKDIEWLKNEVNELPLRFLGFSMLKQREEFTVSKDDVLELIDQLDEPETVEETTHLLENVLKENKRLGELLEEKHEEWLELMGIINNRETENLSLEWINEKTVEVYTDTADAEVHAVFRMSDLQNLLVPKQEEEQKYNVKFKVKSSFGTVGIFLYKKGDEVLAGDNFRAYYPKEDEYRLTEQEIRDFQNGDILFEHFAVKVEELEE